MELAFTTMNRAIDPPPDVMGRELEARGYSAWFIGEHSHIPTSRRTPYPAGGEMPEPYLYMMDPFVSLAVAATATTRLRLGLGVCLVLEHHVLELAKKAATLDVLSGGRLEFGVGVGWNEEELANHRPDIAWSHRYRAAAECVDALRALWTQDQPEFHGQWFDFDPVWSYPKPLQQPHPPIIMGAGGPLGTEHALEWADGWMPMDIALGNVARRVARFREKAEARGRSVSISMVTYGDPTAELLHEYRSLGIDRVVVGAARVGWEDPGTIMECMDRYAPLIPELA